MAKDIKKNYIYNLAYQVFTLLIPLITIPYLSRVFNADGIGIASYVESVVAYFVLFATLSVNTYGQREISYVQNDIEQRSVVFWETTIFKFITTIISLIFYGLFILLAVGSSQRILYMIMATQIITVAFDIVWFFQGLEEFKKVVFRNLIVKLVSVVFVFSFVNLKEDLALYLFGMSACTLAGAISLWFYLPKYVVKISLRTLRPFRNIKTILLLFIPAIAIQIYTVLDKTMIGVITQEAFQNGYYEQAMRISKVALTILTAMGTVMAPRIGYYYQKGETDQIKSAIYRSYRVVWLLGIPLTLGMICIADYFIPWFLGTGFEPTILLLQILSLLILAIGLSNVTGIQYLLPTKQENSYTLILLVGAVINFTFNLVFIFYYQALGAAISSVIAETVITVGMFWIVRHELSVIKILKSSISYWIAGTVMFVFLVFEKNILFPSITGICFMIFSGAIIYFAVLLLMKDEFILHYGKAFIQMIFNR